MSLKTKSLVFGLMAAGALFAVTATQAAEARLFSLKHGVLPNFATKAFVSDSGSGSPGVQVQVDGWAFIDPNTCIQIGTPAPFVVPTDDPRGTWFSDVENLPSSCGQNANFSMIYFTQTRGTPGKLDNKRMSALTIGITKKYRNNFGLSRHAKIVDFVSITLN